MTTNHLDRSFMVLEKSSISDLLEEHRVLDNATRMLLKDWFWVSKWKDCESILQTTLCRIHQAWSSIPQIRLWLLVQVYSCIGNQGKNLKGYNVKSGTQRLRIVECTQAYWCVGVVHSLFHDIDQEEGWSALSEKDHWWFDHCAITTGCHSSPCWWLD